MVVLTLALLIVLFRFPWKKEHLTGYAIGVLYGLGIMLMGLNKVSVVKGFLSMSKDWNPTLLFSLGTCFLFNVISLRYIA